MDNKFDLIFNNKVNGNLTDYSNAIKKLTKLELLDFIEYSIGQKEIERFITINSLRLALEV